jgi:hypothetical protein
MGSGTVRTGLFAAAAIMLAGCGSFDVSSLTPGFFSSPAPKPPPTEPEPPDIVPFIRANIGMMFDTSADVRNISVSQPRPGPDRRGWTACVRASVKAADGRRLGLRTYLIMIGGGKIEDRRQALPEDGCDRETYQAV